MAEKMLTNWFTFLLYKFLKVGWARGDGWAGLGNMTPQGPTGCLPGGFPLSGRCSPPSGRIKGWLS